jgi:beta-glucosidase
LPPYEEYSMKERTYRYMTSKPLYPFGYGLSYTEFSFNDLHLDREELAADESLTVSVKVKNNGALDAEEVVQLYVSVPDPDGIQPRWSLKNFARVTLEKGSSTEVSFKLDRQALEQFKQDGETAVVPGEYRVYVGNGSPGERSKELGVQMVTSTFHVNDGD